MSDIASNYDIESTQHTDETETNVPAKLGDLLRTPQFYMLFMMYTLTILHGTFIAGSSKTWAQSKIHDDKYLSFIAAISNIFGAFRFFWSFLLDKYSFKAVYGTMILIQLIIGLVLPTILELENESLKEALYGMCICVSFNIEGAHFVTMPTTLAKLFGPSDGIRVFSVGFSFIALASLINLGLFQIFLDIIGFSGLCYLYALFGVLALIILCRYKEEKVNLKD